MKIPQILTLIRELLAPHPLSTNTDKLGKVKK